MLENVQTVQDEGAEEKYAPYVEIAFDADKGKWFWCLKSGNGRQICISAIGYTKPSEAKEAFDNAKELATKVIKYLQMSRSSETLRNIKRRHKRESKRL